MIPAGPELMVSEGDEVTAGQALTNNPNVGGFGQKDTEIVLQSSARIKGLAGVLCDCDCVSNSPGSEEETGRKSSSSGNELLKLKFKLEFTFARSHPMRSVVQIPGFYEKAGDLFL
jgi:hypothetical protein